MAALDVETICSDEQSLVKATGTYKSDRSVDLWNGQTSAPTDVLGNTIPSDPGKGDIEVLCQVVEAFTSTSSDGTVQAQLVMADDEDLSTNQVVLKETAALVCPAIGTKFKLGTELPLGVTKRFVGFVFITAVHAPLTGKITAAIGTGIRQADWYQ